MQAAQTNHRTPFLMHTFNICSFHFVLFLSIHQTSSTGWLTFSVLIQSYFTITCVPLLFKKQKIEAEKSLTFAQRPSTLYSQTTSVSNTSIRAVYFTIEEAHRRSSMPWPGLNYCGEVFLVGYGQTSQLTRYGLVTHGFRPILMVTAMFSFLTESGKGRWS